MRGGFLIPILTELDITICDFQFSISSFSKAISTDGLIKYACLHFAYAFVFIAIYEGKRHTL